MNKRRERLSPVIDAERRKSGVLERRTHGLEAENAQLGRDLVLARTSIAKSLATIRGLQDKNQGLQRRCDESDATTARWKGTAEKAWAYNREFRDTPVWRIAAQRIAARFKESK